jgi:hypothetical protein
MGQQSLNQPSVSADVDDQTPHRSALSCNCEVCPVPPKRPRLFLTVAFKDLEKLGYSDMDLLCNEHLKQLKEAVYDVMCYTDYVSELDELMPSLEDEEERLIVRSGKILISAWIEEAKDKYNTYLASVSPVEELPKPDTIWAVKSSSQLRNRLATLTREYIGELEKMESLLDDIDKKMGTLGELGSTPHTDNIFKSLRGRRLVARKDYRARILQLKVPIFYTIVDLVPNSGEDIGAFNDTRNNF